MKVYKEITNVSFGAEYSKEFTAGIAQYVREFQDNNMQVEIQYSTCSNNGEAVYSALILAYTEE